MHVLLQAAVAYCGDVAKFKTPHDVLCGLDLILRKAPISGTLHVLGTWYWPRVRPTDTTRWIEDKTVFMLASRELVAEYLATAREHGLSPTTLLGRRKSAPYTLTEAMHEVRPIGNGRWLINLFHKYGIRDCLYCPFTQWTLAYSSSRPIDVRLEVQLALSMAANAAVGRIEKLKRFPQMAADLPLSARELEVLRLAASGLTASQIAAKLGLGTNTVRHAIERATRRLKAKNVVQAVAQAICQGFIDC